MPYTSPGPDSLCCNQSRDLQVPAHNGIRAGVAARQARESRTNRVEMARSKVGPGEVTGGSGKSGKPWGTAVFSMVR